jgi:hypothetical protein
VILVGLAIAFVRLGGRGGHVAIWQDLVSVPIFAVARLFFIALGNAMRRKDASSQSAGEPGWGWTSWAIAVMGSLLVVLVALMVTGLAAG